MAESRRTDRPRHITHRVHPAGSGRQPSLSSPAPSVRPTSLSHARGADNTPYPCGATSRPRTSTASRCTGRAPSPAPPPLGREPVIARRVRPCPQPPRAGPWGRHRPPGRGRHQRQLPAPGPAHGPRSHSATKSSSRQQARSANEAHLSLPHQPPQPRQSSMRNPGLAGWSPGVQLPPPGQDGLFTPIAHRRAAG
jgi:hypothetical protein